MVLWYRQQFVVRQGHSKQRRTTRIVRLPTLDAIAVRHATGCLEFEAEQAGGRLPSTNTVVVIVLYVDEIRTALFRQTEHPMTELPASRVFAD